MNKGLLGDFLIVLSTLLFSVVWATDGEEPNKATTDITNKAILEYHPKAQENVIQPKQTPPSPVEIETEYASPTDVPSGQTIDERPLWRLLSQRKYAVLDQLLQQYERWYPGWKPPTDLMIGVLKGRRDNASWQKIIDLSRTQPGEFSCNKIYNRWTLADAYRATKQTQALYALYLSIVKTCPNPKHRLITLQRASKQFTLPQLSRLIAAENRWPVGPADERARSNFIYGLYSAQLARAVNQGNAAQVRDSSRAIASRIKARRDANLAMLLGWWSLQHANTNEARSWFKQAYGWRPDAKTAYALGIADLRAKDQSQAKELASRWSLQKNPAFAHLFAPQPTLKGGAALVPETDGAGFGEAWRLYRQGEYQEAADRFARFHSRRHDWESGKGLVLSLLQLHNLRRIKALANQDRSGNLAFLEAPAMPQDNTERADLYYQYSAQKMLDSYEHKDYRTVTLLGEHIADAIKDRHDDGLAVVLGWSYLELQQVDAAETWFQYALAWQPDPKRAYGLAQSMVKRGDLLAAEKLAEEWGPQSPELRELQASSILQRANEAYAQQQFHDSMRLAEHSNRLAPTRAAQLLLAWSHYRLGDTGNAEALFSELYRAEQDQESADGLFAAGVANRRVPALNALAGTAGGPLRTKIRDYLAQQYFDQDQFVLAESYRSERYPGLLNIGSSSLALLPYGRYRSGEQGLGRMDMAGADIEFKGGWGRHRIKFDLDIINLFSGTPSPNAALGTIGRPWITTPTTDALGLVEPWLQYQYQGSVSPYFAIGSTPLNGEVDPLPVGRLGAIWRHQRGAVDVRFFGENVQQSILSTSGITDPATGDHWGRVIEYGLRANLWQRLQGPWNLGLNGTAAWLSGHQVKGNAHFGGGIHLGYDLRVPEFEYFLIGPSYRFDHYDNNQRFFTFGHGGYFSPDTFHRVGAELFFQTREGSSRFVASGRAFLGYQNTREENVNAFPLTGTGPLFNGSSNSGIAFDTDLAGVYRVNNQLQVGAFVRAIQTENFTDFGGGLMLRFIFQPRPAVFSTDIPAAPWNY